jgi:dienelactone hydrolase
VFILDTYTQRGMGEKCDGGRRGLSSGCARDASEALLHLAHFDSIDMRRVAAIGFSQGSRVLYWLARDGVMDHYTDGRQHFAAFVAMYGECYNRIERFAWLGDHISTPLLSLLGERDEDGDPQECLPRLQKAKAAGSPVEWHVFLLAVGVHLPEPAFRTCRTDLQIQTTRIGEPRSFLPSRAHRVPALPLSQHISSCGRERNRGTKCIAAGHLSFLFPGVVLEVNGWDWTALER